MLARQERRRKAKRLSRLVDYLTKRVGRKMGKCECTTVALHLSIFRVTRLASQSAK